MRLKTVLAAATAACLMAASAAQAQAACFHAQNTLGVQFYSYNSAAQAVAVCQVNSPVGTACYYEGFW